MPFKSSHAHHEPGLLGLILTVYVAPVLLIYVGVVPFAWRFEVLVLMTAGVAILSRRFGYSASELGFGSLTLRKSLQVNLALSAALAVALSFGLKLGAVHLRYSNHESVYFYVFYVFVSSPCQEFLYRCFFFAKMRRAGIGSVSVQVAISAAIFAFLHVIYRDPITLFLALGIGVVWGMIYSKAPNFWGISLSHAILGALTIAAGLI